MTSSQEHVNEGAPELDLSGLEAALTRLYEARAQVGRIPPRPATLRARVGEVMIRSVRRTLFWLLPQLDGFHAATVQCADEQFSVIRQLVAGEAIRDEEICRIRMGTPVGLEGSKGYMDLSPEKWLESIRQRADLPAPILTAAPDDEMQKVPGSAGL